MWQEVTRRRQVPQQMKKPSIAKTVLKRFHEIGVISYELVTLRSGRSAALYCDIKKAYGYPDILNALAELIATKLKKNENCIAVSGYGGLPLGAVIAAKYKRQLVTVREIVKPHGRAGLLGGYLPGRGDRVVVLDDVLTTGSSIRATVKELRKTKAIISRAIVVVQRSPARLPIPYKFLFKLEEIP